MRILYGFYLTQATTHGSFWGQEYQVYPPHQC